MVTPAVRLEVCIDCPSRAVVIAVDTGGRDRPVEVASAAAVAVIAVAVVAVHPCVQHQLTV